MTINLHNPMEHLVNPSKMSPPPYLARLQVLLDTLFILYLTNSLAQLCLPLSYSCPAFRPVGSILWPADDKEDQVTATWLNRRADGKKLSSNVTGQENLAKKDIQDR